MSDPSRDPYTHSDPAASGEFTRRTLVKRGLLAGGALAGSGLIISELLSGGSSPHSRAPARVPSKVPAPVAQAPNILVIVVDQLRSNPRWISKDPVDAALMPNLARLSREGVNFASHYTASNDCTPSRSTLLTGLYTHQTGCMITAAARWIRAFRPGGRCCANTATRPTGMASGISPIATTTGTQQRLA